MVLLSLEAVQTATPMKAKFTRTCSVSHSIFRTFFEIQQYIGLHRILVSKQNFNFSQYDCTATESRFTHNLNLNNKFLSSVVNRIYLVERKSRLKLCIPRLPYIFLKVGNPDLTPLKYQSNDSQQVQRQANLCNIISL